MAPSFSCRVHRLKDQEDGMAIRRIVKLLHRVQLRDVVFQQFLILLFRFVDGFDDRRPFLEVDLVALPYPKIVGIDFHSDPFGEARLGDLEAAKNRNLHQIQDEGENRCAGKRSGYHPGRQGCHGDPADALTANVEAIATSVIDDAASQRLGRVPHRCRRSRMA
jgi:hypothetical protein